MNLANITTQAFAEGVSTSEDKRGVEKCEYTVGEPSNPAFSVVGGTSKGVVESGGSSAIRVVCAVPEKASVGSRLRGTVEVHAAVHSVRRVFVVHLVAEVGPSMA